MNFTEIRHRLARLAGVCFIVPVCIGQVNAQDFPESWATPFPGHRVVANLYAVGTEGLGVFLVTSDDGHVLINTGLADSAPLIQENIESVGFHIEDVKILLTMQAHFDHVAALAEIKQITGAQVWATSDDARLLADGGLGDPLFGGSESFTPVSVNKTIHHGDVIELGDTRLHVHEHPGHTEGSSSYSMRVREGGRYYDVVMANMGSINPGTKLLVDPTYPGIAADFAETYRRQRDMDVDVWVAAHGGQYRLLDKFKPGQAYSPDRFVDPDGFIAEVDRLEQVYLELLAEQQR